MRHLSVTKCGLLAVLLAVVLVNSGCGGTEAPKTPLGGAPAGSPTQSAPAASAISGEARLALDSANALFRVKAYDRAKAHYLRAADLVPEELAPLLGVMMVADATNDSKLAEATLPRIRKLDPTYSDSAAKSHSKVMKAHPPTVAPPLT